MFRRIAEWLQKRVGGRPFEAFQIEVTTRCLLRCAMCPRVALAEQWPEMDLPWETFQRLASAFDRTRHVHLQGWGEPLLHIDMIALAKGAGCRVGLTTNGMRLELATGQRLLELDLDLIAISIAGATADTHERIRVGSDFALILENVRRLLALRAAQEKRRPKVELSYLMTRANVVELPKAVELAASLSVDELFATNLDYVVTPEHDDLKAFGCPPLREAFVRTVDEARAAVQLQGRDDPGQPADDPIHLLRRLGLALQLYGAGRAGRYPAALRRPISRRAAPPVRERLGTGPPGHLEQRGLPRLPGAACETSPGGRGLGHRLGGWPRGYFRAKNAAPARAVPHLL